MTKAELVSEVCEKSNVSKKDAASVIENTFATITNALAKGDKITLVGFGTFETNERRHTQEEIQKQEQQSRLKVRLRFGLSREQNLRKLSIHKISLKALENNTKERTQIYSAVRSLVIWERRRTKCTKYLYV